MVKGSNYWHRRLLKYGFYKYQILHKSCQSWILIRIYQYKTFGDKQMKYVGRGSCLKCLLPLRKFSAALDMCKVTFGVAWRPGSHMCVWVTSGGGWCPVSQSHVCKWKNWMSIHSNRGGVKSQISLQWGGLKV